MTSGDGTSPLFFLDQLKQWSLTTHFLFSVSRSDKRMNESFNLFIKHWGNREPSIRRWKTEFVLVVHWSILLDMISYDNLVWNHDSHANLSTCAALIQSPTQACTGQLLALLPPFHSPRPCVRFEARIQVSFFFPIKGTTEGSPWVFHLWAPRLNVASIWLNTCLNYLEF